MTDDVLRIEGVVGVVRKIDFKPFLLAMNFHMFLG